MEIVALTRLATPVEDEARALARDLGALPYEQRLKLNAGMPAVVLTTPDAARARDLCAALRARGHDALHCQDADVTAADAMVELRRFRFEDDALVSTYGTPARLGWRDVGVMIRAVHRTSMSSTRTVKEKQFSAVRAVVTGGLLTSKTTSHTLTRTTADREAVLYLFPRTGATPWILHEQRAHYDALGDAVSSASVRNFELTCEALRTRAPHAVFDERLVARKVAPADVDLLAHLIACAHGERMPSPFR